MCVLGGMCICVCGYVDINLYVYLCMCVCVSVCTDLCVHEERGLFHGKSLAIADTLKDELCKTGQKDRDLE